MKKRKALLLISGGLDSTLAAYVIKEQGVDLTILFFINPFNMCEGGCGDKTLAEKTANKLGIEFKTKLVFVNGPEIYIEMVCER